MTSAAESFNLDPGHLAPDVKTRLEILEGDKNVRYNRYHVQETLDFLNVLRPQVKDVKEFWLLAMLSHENVAPHITAKLDQHALSFLKDVELKQEANEFRPFEIVFHFAENPYFSNKTLSKRYTLKSGLTAAPADGSITDELRDFEPDQLDPDAEAINWKSDSTNLCAIMPRGAQKQGKAEEGEADDLDGFEGDVGSFFHFFQEKGDMFQLGLDIKDELLPNAFAYFDGRGEHGGDSDSEDDELDEEDDEDEDEIDLENEEKPKKKKRKVCKDGCC